MVDNYPQKRRPGRPLAFDPEAALDAATLVFWQYGYDRADTETLAKAMGVTKPSIYGTFGSKEQLYLKSLQRYMDTIGGRAMVALANAETIQAGVRAFFDELLANIAGQHGVTGCMINAATSQCSSAMPNVAAFLGQGLQQTDDAFAAYFQKAVDEGVLPCDFPVVERAQIMCDLMHGLSVRARAGGAKLALERSADAAVTAILQT
jgi:AcrR family transcriptional regulator